MICNNTNIITVTTGYNDESWKCLKVYPVWGLSIGKVSDKNQVFPVFQQSMRERCQLKNSGA